MPSVPTDSTGLLWKESFSDAGVPLKEPQEDETFKLNGEEGPYEGLEAAVSAVDGVLSHGLLLGVTAAIVVSDKGPLSLFSHQTTV